MDLLISPIWIIFLVPLLVLLANYIYLKRRGAAIAKIPGPPDNPTMGNLTIVADCENFSEVQATIYRLFDKYGSVFRMWMGDELWICTTDNGLIKDVLEDWSTRDAVPLYNYYGYCKQSQFVHKKSFMKKEVYDVELLPILEEVEVTNATEKLVNEMKATLAGKTKKIDEFRAIVQRYFETLLQKTEWRIMASQDVHVIPSCPVYPKVYKSFVELQLSLTTKVMDLMPIPDYVKYEVKAHAAFSDKSNWEQKMTVNPRLSKDTLELNFTQSHLNDLKDEMKQKIASDIAECADITSTFVVNLLLNIAANQQIIGKIENEMKSVLAKKDKKISFDDEPNFKYTEMVVKEGLRLYSPPAVLKQIGRNIENNNITIPKHSIIFISSLYVHRNHEYYENPCTFTPEHFTEEKENSRPSSAYLPLNLEPTNCKDKLYMRRIVKILLAAILKNFKVETSIEDVKHDYFLMGEIANNADLRFTAV